MNTAIDYGSPYLCYKTKQKNPHYALNCLNSNFNVCHFIFSCTFASDMGFKQLVGNQSGKIKAIVSFVVKDLLRFFVTSHDEKTGIVCKSLCVHHHGKL